MNITRSATYLLCSLGLFATLSGESDPISLGDTLSMPTDQINTIIRQSAMPDLGEGRLARILTRYYKTSFGGAEKWDQISSLKVSGMIKLAGGEFEMIAYQKKPDLFRLRILHNVRDFEMGFDGTTAWQRKPGRNTEPEALGEDEARRFIHGARFGNYLLHPYADGKKIQYIDTVPTEGNLCHHIRVTLDTEYQVDYFIDIRVYLELKSIHTDFRSGSVASVVYKDYIHESGMPIAKQIENFENGEWVSTLTLDDFKVNSGLMPWMFEMRQ
ncbi:MAG: hypothetical protein ISR41_01080 [Puniceicoccaceae bacterium]|nr:hypothetical protein [Puniceicoccaceae bacterium]